MQIRRHVTPPTDDHQLRLIALAYNVADDVMNTASDDDDDDDDDFEDCEDSSLSENDSPRIRLHHDKERRRRLYHYR